MSTTPPSWGSGSSRAGNGRAHAGLSAWQDVLVSAVQPDLLDRFAQHPQRRAASLPGFVATPEMVDAIVDAAAAGEPCVVEQHIEAARIKGATEDVIVFELLSAAARQLGEDWDADRRDILDVTIGLGTLHEALATLSAQTEPLTFTAPAGRSRRLLLLAAPGDTHTFGLFLVAYLFRKSGWWVSLELQIDLEHLADHVGATWYDVAGIGLSDERQAHSAQAAAACIRAASYNQDIGIVLGGTVCGTDPEMAASVGADRIVTDAKDALDAAETLRSYQAASRQGH